jgi:PST family polysaccharide transporter
MRLTFSQLLPNFLRQRLEKHGELRRIAGNTGWLFAERILRMGLSLVVLVWLARHLGPEQFGTYNYAIAFVLLFSELTTLGLNAILVRDIVNNPEDSDEIVGTAFVMRLFGGLLSLALSFTLISLLRPDDLLMRLLVTIVAFGTIFRAFEVIDYYFQSRVESKYVVMAKVAAFVATSASTVLLILANASLPAFVAVKAAEYVLTGVGLALMYRYKSNLLSAWRFSFDRGKSLVKQSWPLILSGFGAIVYLKVDQVMLGEMIGEAAVGIYAVAAQLSEVWYFIPLAIATSVFPSLLKSKQASPEAYHGKLQSLYDFLVILALVITVPVAALSTPLVTMLYGEVYREAGGILAIHIWASLFIFMRAALSKWLIAEGLFIFSLVTHGLGAITNVLINLMLIPLYGGTGAAIATVISYAAASYLALFFHPKTWIAARMMTLALLLPLRSLAKVRALVRQG